MIEAIDGSLLGLAYILAETVKYQITKRNGKNGLSSTAEIREFDRLGATIKDQSGAIKEQVEATRELRYHLGDAIKEQTDATRELRDAIREIK